MAGTPIVTAMLVSVVAVHLFGVGTPVFAGEVPCKDRCNLSHGECSPSGECRCQPGWEGPDCEQCTKGYGCVYGTCHQPWQCNCLPGWGGRNCDIDQEVCERKMPCQNDARCVNNGNGEYLCVCKPGFDGTNCETYNPYRLSNDDSHPPPVIDIDTALKTAVPVKECQNGGLCKISALTGGCKKCICSPGFTGDHCETTVDDCLTMPCANGGKCFDLHNDFHCECERGFTGRFCGDDIDECEVVPDICHNGGTCNNTFGSYDCTCASGYKGVRCDEKDQVEREEKPYIPLLTRVIAAAEKQTTTPETTTSAAVEEPVLKVVKNPEPAIKVTRVTHEVKITNGDAHVVINPNSERDVSGSSTMQILTFVFMAVAIFILGVILALVWVRCFRNQSKVRSEKDVEYGEESRIKIASVGSKVKTSGGAIYRPPTTTVIEADTDSIEEELHIASTQPCIPHTDLKRENIPNSPSPPPPYALSAVDVRRSTIVRQPNFVALPPMAKQSRPQPSEKQRMFMAAYDVTSRDDTAESSSLLDADSPTLSHKIVV